MSELITTPMFRASYVTLFEPKAFVGQKPKYSVVMLFDKSTDITALKKAAGEAVIDKWPDAAKRPSNLKSPFRDGDAERSDKEGYQGCTFVNASANEDYPPQVVDQNKQAILSKPEFYSGCYARARIKAYTYDVGGNAGVSFGLWAVQKMKDGESLGGGNAANDFEVVETATAFDDSASRPTTEADNMFG